MKCSVQIVLILLCSAAMALAQNTVLLMDSDPGDYIGAGANYYFTPADGAFSANKNFDNGVSITFSNGSENWSLDFAAPGSALLETQAYAHATGFPFQDSTAPGLDVYGDARGCNTLTGEFEVKEIVYGSDDTVTSFHATFTQHCEGFAPALTGEILYNSSDAVPPKNHITSPLTAYATRNHFFQYTIRASNSPTSYTASNLPAGLSLEMATGLVSGTPSVQGTFAIPISAIGGDGTASATLQLVIDPPGQSTGPYTALFMESDSGDYIGQGLVYLFTPADGYFNGYAAANTASISFTSADDFDFWTVGLGSPVESTLGIGPYFNALRFGSSANPSIDIYGSGRGCNQTSGDFEVEELSTFGAGELESFRASFEQHCEEVEPALRGEVWLNSMNAITSDPFVEGMRNAPLSYQIIANNQPTSYGASALPAGLTFSSTSGIISGTPTVAGNYRILVTAIGPGETAAGRITMQILPPDGDLAPVVTSERRASGTIQQPFSYQITADNAPASFSAAGLPAGVTLDSVTGLISGTPSVTGTFDVIVTATNGSGTGGRSLTLAIYPPLPVITSPDHVTASAGKLFSFQVTASNQATGFSTSGLPAGLTIGASNGLISGTPTATGTYTVTVRAGNGTGVGVQTLTLTVNLTTPVITSPLAAAAAEGESFSYQITADGLPTSFGASGLPAGLSVSSYNGFISGVPAGKGIFNVTLSATNAAGIGHATLILDLTAKPSQLQNLSTRLAVGSNDAVLIGGFIVSGTELKTLLIRGIGPTLSDFGVPGVLSDPILELHDSSGATIASNDNWKDTQAAEIQATQLAPANDAEPAILFSFPANGAAYTAILRGKDNATGVGLVEVYDVSGAADSLVANISTRGVVGTGDNVMIGGFIVGGGSADGNVVARAIGPSLGSFGIAEPLLDPILELHDGEGNTIATNDNWKDSQQEQLEAVGLAPTDDHESAIKATLPVGPYTALVRGQNDTTGVALVEVYRLP